MESFTTPYYLHGEFGPTFERYFSQVIAGSIGPFIDLGNPKDYLPPEGAARSYADDRAEVAPETNPRGENWHPGGAPGRLDGQVRKVGSLCSKKVSSNSSKDASDRTRCHH